MRKKILFLIESLSGGGAEKVLSVLLRHFNHEHYQLNVCTMVDTGVYCEAIKSCASHYSSVVSYSGGLVRRTFNRLKYKLIYSWLPLSWVYRFFVPKNNDVEIAFCEGYVTKLLSQSRSDARKIAWVHTDLTANPWPQHKGIFANREEERRAYLRYDCVVCVSNAVEAVMRWDYGLENTVVLYNPVDEEAISMLAREGCPLHMDASCFNIVAIGRLVPQKGFDDLIRIVADLVNDLACVHLYIIGEGSERIRLEKMIGACNMKDHIHLTGFLPNPYALLSRADLYVCSSRAEGFSLTVAEAMVLGIPIISTNCAGPAELLEHGRFGEICQTGEDLSAALKKAASDKDYLAGLQTKSRDGKTRFNKENALRQFKGVLVTVLQ